MVTKWAAGSPWSQQGVSQEGDSHQWFSSRFDSHSALSTVSEAQMDLSEAEIQVLVSLEKAGIEAAPTDRASLENSGERYWIFLEEWKQTGLPSGHGQESTISEKPSFAGQA
jgi:hypothetical protein